LGFLCSVKVLILHQHFKTPERGGAIRSYYLAKALVENGIETIVITAHNGKYKEQEVEGIHVCYLSIPYDNSFDFGRRSSSFLRFARSSSVLASKFKDADLCYAISVPLTVGLAALWIKRRHGIPFMFEVGDLWPDAPIELGFIKNFFFKSFLYSLEKRIYRKAKAVIALSPPIKSAIERKIRGINVRLIPNMADTNFYVPEEKISGLEKKFNVEGKFVVSYLGAVGIANGLDYLLDCAHACRQANLNIQFIICGEGALKNSLIKRAANLDLKNLSFTEFQDREGVREVMNITDATFICYKNSPILETGSPNKFFDGLAAGKVIIVNFGGWIRKEVEENSCGVHVNPNDPVHFVDAIRPYFDNRELTKQAQQSARRLAEKFSREKLSKEFLTLVNRS
jgi:glycosyltransferase involved in cell wall biosynthesis